MPEFVTNDGLQVSPMAPADPKDMEWERDRWKRLNLSKGAEWRGCNHCGKFVSDERSHIIFTQGGGRSNLYMHYFCHYKLYQLEYARAMFGKDFAKGFRDAPSKPGESNA